MHRLFPIIVALVALVALVGCGGADDDGSGAPRDAPAPTRAGSGGDDVGTIGGASSSPGIGLAVVTSEQPFDDTVADLLAALEANPAITVIAEVDHAANASSVGLELPPTVEIFFGNPMLGTPLMQASRTVGIDLPQKLLVFERDGEVRLAWNTPAYLAARHGLDGVDDQLDAVGTALAMLADAAGGGADQLAPDAAVQLDTGAGLVSEAAVGDTSVAAATDRLRTAIEAQGNLTLVAEVDHAANASSVGLELPPTVELVFGNPTLGTPLMQAERTLAIDLPQRILIAEVDGEVAVTYNDPAYLAERHGIDPTTPELSTIASALDMLASVATGR